MSSRSAAFEKQLAGRYRFERPVGRGGMGEVWLAHDTKFERAVAIKILATHLSDDAEFAERFHREYKTLAKFSHPRIIAIHDAGAFPEGGRLYMVMEMLPGKTLRVLLEEHRQAGTVMSPVSAAFHAIQMLDGLGAAHDQGIIHRDVKPENMIVNVSGHLKLVDFGVAKAAERTGPHRGEAPCAGKPFRTKESMLVGTPRFMAPELVAGRPIDHRVDLYAVGHVLVFMLTNEYAYRVDPNDELAVVKAHLEQAPVLRRENNPDCPEILWATALRLLEKDPDARFPDADAASEELSAFLRQSAPPGHPMEKEIRAERRERAHRRAFESFGGASLVPPSPPAQTSAPEREDGATDDDDAAAPRSTALLPGEHVGASPCSPAALALATTARAARRPEPPAADATKPVTPYSKAREARAPFPPAPPPGLDATRPLPAGALPPVAREPYPLARPAASAQPPAGVPARPLPRRRVRRLKDRLLVLSGVAIGVLGSFALVAVVLVLVSRPAVPPSVGAAGATTAPGSTAAPAATAAVEPAPAPSTSASAAPVPSASASAAVRARTPLLPRRQAPRAEPILLEGDKPVLHVLPRPATRPNDPPAGSARLF